MENDDTNTYSETFQSIGFAVSKLVGRIKRQRETVAELAKRPEPKPRPSVREESAQEGPIRADDFERTNVVSGARYHHTPANLNIAAHARHEAPQAIVYDANGIMPHLARLAGR